MKKIININFHGRVVPIEESAHDILQQYVDSLRKYFANEEGRDEIINDIENRFAELFSELLKKGSTCITDADVNSIITSMGRPEDFEQEELSSGTASSGTAGTGSNKSGSSRQSADEQKSYQSADTEPRRLYRSENDKMIAGVCGGLANYLRVDPAVVRLFFILFGFGAGLGIPLYFVMWIILPKKSLALNVRKRLFRNPDDRVIAGVASGLASYFHIEVWIPRLIFALPLVLGVITSLFHNVWFVFHHGPVFFTGGFGGTLLITYIVLWIVLPEAVTASDKLEMRGEKVDLESIKNTIKSDLEGFKNKARDMGDEMKERFQQAGQEMKQAGTQFANTAGPVIRSRSNGLGHAIGVLFKVFFLFIAGIIAFSMIAFLVWLTFNGVGISFKNYLLTGFWQNFLALSCLVLFLGVPIIALVTWLIRRIIGVRSRNNYLGYVFGSLWVIGLVSLIMLVGMVANNFRSRASVEDEVSLLPTSPQKMLIKTGEEKEHYYDSDLFGFDIGDRAPFYSLSEDTFIMKTVHLNLVRSPDSDFHVRRIRFSRGGNPAIAKNIASQIQFDIHQADSILYLPHGFAVTQQQQFRNQQVLVIVSIPVGKKIWVSGDIDNYRWFNVYMNRRNGYNIEVTDDWDNSDHYNTNTEYIMTEKGLKRTGANKKNNDDNDEDQSPETKDDNTEKKDKSPAAGGGYRYKKNTDSVKPGKNNDSIKTKKLTGLQTPENISSPGYLLTALYNQI